MKEAFVGFDSAWAGNYTGAIGYAVFEGNELIRVGLPRVCDFADAARTVEKLQRDCDDVLIAIDQPIIVRNNNCSRPVDRIARSFMARLGSSAQSASRHGNEINQNMFGDDAPIWRFCGRIGPHDYNGVPDLANHLEFIDFQSASAATGETSMIEVYPAMALASLYPWFARRRLQGRRRTARYNPRLKNFDPIDWMLVCRAVENYSNALNLRPLAEWANDMVHPWDSSKNPRKAHQDKIDSALCLVVAILLRRRRREHGLTVIGDLKWGYMVTPASVDALKLLKEAAKKFEVPIAQFF